MTLKLEVVEEILLSSKVTKTRMLKLRKITLFHLRELNNTRYQISSTLPRIIIKTEPRKL
jgi:hypothetical protein